ncbi:MAG TPA: glycoside hydrolase domain-containing protein, partial [Anditalea sp.]|nr:glycoside hydrolase domain-containing protein [Anditalea sp.]
MKISFTFYSTLLFLLFFHSACAQGDFQANFTDLESFGEPMNSSTTKKAWKNESVMLFIKVNAGSTAPIKVKISSPRKNWSNEIYHLAYVKGDLSAGYCGQDKIDGEFATQMFPDRAIPVKVNTTYTPDSIDHYVMVRIKTDQKIKSKTFPLTITLAQGDAVSELKAEIQVLGKILPSLSQLDLHTDFWQHPRSVAEYHDVIPYSDEHMDHLEKNFDQLAEINQNSITTSVFWDLFNTSKKDPKQMMIQTSKKSDGSYSFDYTNFEKYVKLGISKGIDKQISVHNLFPWNNFLFYYDEEKGEVEAIRTLPMTPVYKEFWVAFLDDFGPYLKKQGWHDKVVFVIDERNAKQTLEVIKFVHEIDPNFKMGYAGRFYPSLSPHVYDYSVPVNVVMEDDVIESRKKAGQITSLYTTCFEKQPNMLLMSNPMDIYFILMLAKAKGYDGMLRWAFNLWSPQIPNNAIYTDLPSGDAHFVYPEGQNSLRYFIIKDALEEVQKMEVQRQKRNTRDMLKAHQRYYLLNVESSRMEMIKSMKNHLND